MRILHTMLRVRDLDASKHFYCGVLGMRVLREKEYPDGKFTLCFVGFGDEADSSVLELTYNWERTEYALGDAFGHVAIGTHDIYETCAKIRAAGATISREPGPMKYGGSVIAFVEDPNGYKIELIQREAKTP